MMSISMSMFMSMSMAMNFDMDFSIGMIDNSDEFGLPSSKRALKAPKVLEMPKMVPKRRKDSEVAKYLGAKKKGAKGAKKKGKKGGRKGSNNGGEKGPPEKEGDSKGTKEEGKAPTGPLPKEGRKGDDTKDTKKRAERRRLRIHQGV
jgi:hypothetical protein